MKRFEPGAVLHTYLGHSVTIDSHIASSGQHDVYKVTVEGMERTLVWCKPNFISNYNYYERHQWYIHSIDGIDVMEIIDADGSEKPYAEEYACELDESYNILKMNVKKGPPDRAFLWPMDVTERIDGTFGYITDLIPDGYYELTDILMSSGGGGFTSFKVVVESAIRIVSAFRNLNKAGFIFQTLNSGSFFINPKTGDVRICDIDNITPGGLYLGIEGTLRYMAPEMVMGEAKPNTHTDEFSLAIVLFMLLCGGHPLEGEHWACPCLAPQLEEKLYGSDALFIFDPNDESNRPVKGVHLNVIKRWELFPQYMKDIFIEAFSQEVIKNPGKRVKYTNWLKALIRFQSDIVRCPECQNEIFITDASDTECERCHKLYEVKHTLKLQDYSVTAVKNTRIYRCQLGACNADAALNPVALVVASKNDPSVLGLRNMTKGIMVETMPGGKTNQVKPGNVIPLKTGISISIFDSKIDIQ